MARPRADGTTRPTTSRAPSTAERTSTRRSTSRPTAHGRQGPAAKVVGPAVTVDVRAKANADADYRVLRTDLQAFEAAHGRIPARRSCCCAGLDPRWPDRAATSARPARLRRRGEAALPWPLRGSGAVARRRAPHRGRRDRHGQHRPRAVEGLRRPPRAGRPRTSRCSRTSPTSTACRRGLPRRRAADEDRRRQRRAAARDRDHRGLSSSSLRFSGVSGSVLNWSTFSVYVWSNGLPSTALPYDVVGEPQRGEGLLVDPQRHLDRGPVGRAGLLVPAQHVGVAAVDGRLAVQLTRPCRRAPTPAARPRGRSRWGPSLLVRMAGDLAGRSVDARQCLRPRLVDLLVAAVLEPAHRLLAVHPDPARSERRRSCRRARSASRRSSARRGCRRRRSSGRAGACAGSRSPAGPTVGTSTSAAITAPSAGSASSRRRVPARRVRRATSASKSARPANSPVSDGVRRRGHDRAQGPCQILSGTTKVAAGRVARARARAEPAPATAARANVARAAARGAGGVGGREPFPGDEADRLAVALAQRGEGAARARDRAPKRSAGSPLDRVGRERAAARGLAPVVGEHVAGHGVQPRQRMLDPPRQFAPRDDERLGREILHLVARHAPREVRADRGVMGVVDDAEALRIAHTRHLSRRRCDLQGLEAAHRLGYRYLGGRRSIELAP